MSRAVVGMEEIVAGARAAVPHLAALSTAAKNQAILEIALAVEDHAEEILAANSQDLQRAAEAGTRPALVDRLRLTPARIAGMAGGLRQVAALTDPVGAIAGMVRRPNGMMVGRMRVPIGVILVIYEARPSVTLDAAALCLKAGNAVILRAGREARSTLGALRALLEDVRTLPLAAVQILPEADHGAVRELLQSDGIDLVIPRGGEELIQTVTQLARMPVLKHFKGVCHLFVDRDADLAMARRLILNAKVQRPSVCNALETVLVDEQVAGSLLPGLVAALQEAGVEVRGDLATAAIAGGVVPAGEGDWGREYLDLILAVRVVGGLDEAVEHISRHSTGLADGIVTGSWEAAQRFVQLVDSAAVLVNASTRLVDGGEFGLGAEIGISTDRLGPRGPMGLEELTTTKWVVFGSGQIRE